MYKDGKYAAKERQKKMRLLKRDEKQKKTNRKRKERKRLNANKDKKEKLTTNEKIAITILLVIGVPLGVLLHIYLQAGILDSVLIATTTNAAKNLSAPIDPNNVP